MRESLFRGKRLEIYRCGFDDIDWVEGSLIDSGNHFQVAIFPWVKGASTMGLRQLVHFRMVGVDPATVGQYTGMTDKNGRRIFEGDIVKSIDGQIGYIAFLQQEAGWVIVWKKHDSRMGHRARGCAYNSDCTIEVIGNIHDNPELLQEVNQP